MADHGVTRAPANPMTDTYYPDPCCSKHLAKALRDDALADAWECPKCGCEWKPKMVSGLRYWEPVPYVAIIPNRRR